MILIADSGSSKTDWCCLSGISSNHYQTIGLNPYHIDTSGIIDVLSENLLPKIKGHEVQHLYFYGAGCSNDTKNEVISTALKVLFPNATIHIWHDLLAACRGLYPSGNGLSGILGTGSNVCIYEKGSIKEGITSFGYLLGDEGGGVHLGKLCLKSWLQNKMPKELSDEFAESHKLSIPVVLDAIYKKPQPNRYIAQFTKFVKQKEDHPFFHQIIMQNFDDWFENQVKTLNGYHKYQLSCIGSIAYNFKHQLADVANKHGIEISSIKKSPMDGLIQYHFR